MRGPLTKVFPDALLNMGRAVVDPVNKVDLRP